MASYFGVDEYSAKSFFTSMSAGTRSNNMGSLGIASSNMLSEYTSIKNGSYKKLLTAYYAKNNAKPDGIPFPGEDSKETKVLAEAKSSADELKDSASSLVSDKEGIFALKEVEKKDKETGEVTKVKEYDRDSMYKAVKAFVDDYNELLDSVDDVEAQSVLRAGVSLLKASETNEKLLNQIGITIGKGNKLTIDEKAFKNADVNTIKTLFTGKGSYADNISTKASLISGYSKSEMMKFAGSYNSNARYNGGFMNGNKFDSFF